MDSEQAAGRWFVVRAEYEHLGPVRMLLRVVREFGLALLTAGVFLGEFDPKRFCDVLVLRRDNGDSVTVFSYKNLGAAAYHVENLWVRLSDTHVFDFCRELSIPTDVVVGPGQNELPSRDDLWKPVRGKDRRTKT